MAMLEGTLNKWTNVMKGWQYRWFVLDENAGLLSYYTSKEKMMKGVRRGCVRLKGAVIGIDDQDVNTFTITVDHKTFHFQARDSDEREKWVRRLEDTILRHANRSKMIGLESSMYGVSGNGGSGGGSGISMSQSNNSSTKRPNHLQTFDKKVSEADAYLQLMIEQTDKIANKINVIEDAEVQNTCKEIQDHANAMLDNIKHSIVLLQIAKNTAHPINGIYQGPPIDSTKIIDFDEESLDAMPQSIAEPVTSGSVVELGSECIENRRKSIQSPSIASDSSALMTLVVPETSYSSSEGEDDFFDANDDPFSSSSMGNSLTSVTRQIGESSGQHRIGNDDITDDLRLSDNQDSSNSSETAATAASFSPAPVPIKNDGSLDYDALYEDETETNLSMESHGNVVTHLLSQVKIGMDLTKVVLPTFILERRSLLEMYADYFAHPDLFLKIADLTEPRERMVQVVRWYLSAYHAGRKSAVAKKPYNPILGEIFQCHWDVNETVEEFDGKIVTDGPVPWCKRDQLTFIAEQVSHHPPISAFYAEHYNKKISFCAHVWTKSKFLGLSIGVHNIGNGVVTLCDLQEEYIVTFPNGYGRSILTIPWIELGGSVTITCPQTGYHCDIEFLTKPFYGGKRNKISAEIYAPNEKKSFLSIAGEWSGLMEVKSTDGTKQKPESFVDVNRIPIFKKHVRPISEQTDNESRNIWKEVTAGLKFNDIEKATSAKFAVEQKQRDEAKQRKETNADWDTKYFKQLGESWIYTKPLSQRLYMLERDAKR